MHSGTACQANLIANTSARPQYSGVTYLHYCVLLCRALFPENILFGRDGKLRVGHYVSMIDMKLDKPTGRIDFLDYMAPEMLAMKVSKQMNLAS